MDDHTFVPDGWYHVTFSGTVTGAAMDEILPREGVKGLMPVMNVVEFKGTFIGRDADEAILKAQTWSNSHRLGSKNV